MPCPVRNPGHGKKGAQIHYFVPVSDKKEWRTDGVAASAATNTNQNKNKKRGRKTNILQKLKDIADYDILYNRHQKHRHHARKKADI